MEVQHLKTLAELGRALWADPRQSDPIAVEAITAVNLLDLSEERAIERAASALLEQAKRHGVARLTQANFGVAGVANHPFFRLDPAERFVLVALHLGRWSYARLARILKTESEQVEQLAWRARLAVVGNFSIVGSKLRGTHCPEYEVSRPWTQRFLDEEMPPGKRVFLQNHLMVCDSCRAALSRCRDLYYKVDGLIPRLSENDGVIRNLEKVCSDAYLLRAPADRTFAQSLLIFFSRSDVQWFVAGVLGLLAVMIFRK